MTIQEAARQRHAVRSYTDQPLSQETITQLETLIAECNREGGLHIQLVQNEPVAFGSKGMHYGKFTGVTNYLALIGQKSADLEEKCGYYGEKLVLAAQQMGLNSCWVAMSYKKIPDAFQVAPGEKLVIVIALGYGTTQGVQHKLRSVEELCTLKGAEPDWFLQGMEAVRLAPSALNQQKYRFSLENGKVSVRPGLGFNTKVDLGIAKYHFEIGAGEEHFEWN